MTASRPSFPMIFGRPHPLKLGDGASTPLQLVRLQIEQKVNTNFPLLHQIATTMTFKNTHNISLEGAFEFTLPEKATICGYGLDVAGEIVDGVVIEKQAARIIFEKEVRKRIDPGFVELVIGNIFRTRVYPIEPQKTRTVRVIYQDQAVIDSVGFLYRIPVQFQTQLESLDIILTCFGSQTTKPILQTNSNQISNQPTQFFDRGNGTCTAEWRLTNIQPLANTDQTLSYILPDSLKPVISAVEPNANLGAYFAVSCALPKATEQRVFDQLDVPSKSICILWDASLSRSNSKENRLLELNAMKKIFDIWISTLNQIEIVLIIFRNDMEEKILFQLRSNNWNEFVKIFEDLPYDGATNLSQLSSINFTQTISYYFLFSDCISTLNNDTIGENFLSKFQAPLWILNGNYLHESIDVDLIRYLTEYNQYGGGYLNREKLELDSKDLVTLIQTIQIKYIQVQSPATMQQIYPSKSVSIPLNSDRFLLVGQIPLPLPSSIEFILEFSMNSQVARVPVSLNVSADKSNHFGLIRRLWAQEKLNELNIFKEKNKSEILAIGLEYSIVSHFTSLLVLETIQQHLQYRVCPAKSRTSLYSQYMAYQVQENQKKANNTSQLIQIWSEKCQWYDGAINQNPFRPPVPTGGLFNYYPESGQNYPFGIPPPAGPARPLNQGFGFGASSQAQNPFYHAGPPVPSGIPPSLYQTSTPTFSFASSQPMQQSMMPQQSLQSMMPQQQMQQSIMPQPPISATEKTSATILKESDPQLSYRNVTSATNTPTSAYSIYLTERSSHRLSPSFYFDIASYFLSRKSFLSALEKFNQQEGALRAEDPKLMIYGLRILTNLLELELEAPQLYRTVAYKLMELKQWNLALSIFRKIYLLRADEPQSLRDLALVLMELNQYEQALEYFKQILTETWDSRFAMIYSSVLFDLNRLLNLMNKIPVDIDRRLLRHLPLDLRIVVQWDTPDTTIQLRVQEPSGQICDSALSFSQTNGVGYITKSSLQAIQPIEYLLRRAVHGKYSISLNFQNNAQHTLTGVTTVLVYIYKYFGSVNEEKQIKTIRLTNINEKIDVDILDFNQSITHVNTTCDGCLKTPIVGDRYKCIYCPNVDFCGECQGVIHHRHDLKHPLICVRDPALCASSVALQNRSEMIHLNTNCALCAASPIVGIRYECTICRINICEKCEFLCLHEISHPRIKTIVPS